MNESPAKIVENVRYQIAAMEEHCQAVSEYSQMLGVLTAGEDAECAMDGIHRLVNVILHHASEAKAIGEKAGAKLKRFDHSEVRLCV